MVPYRGRLSLRMARLALALACLGWFGITAGLHRDWLTAVLAAFAVYALGALPEIRYDSTVGAAIGLMADTAYFGLWSRVAPDAWMPAFAVCYLLISAVLLHDFLRTVAVAVVSLLISLLLPATVSVGEVWTER